MEQSEYWLRFWQRRLTRRRVLQTAAWGGAGLAAAGIVGCGDDDEGGPAVAKGGVVRAVLLGGNVFDSVDVHRAFGDPTSWLSNFVLNKVVRYKNPDTGEIEGDLAQSWEVIDPANYVFNIRQDVKWQDTPLTGGRQFTAEDIKWHFERQAAGKLADGTESPFRHQSAYQEIAKIEKPDDFTLRITLAKPNGTFIDRLANYFSTVPNRETTEKFEADHRTLTEEAMAATGAFTLLHWRAGEEIKCQKNPTYFRKGSPNVDGWIYPTQLFEDPNAWRIAFEQKQVDYFYSPDPSQTTAILDANKGQMTEILTGVANTVFLHLNMNQQFKDVRLVQAMNLAFDRRGAIQTFHQGLGQVSGPVPWLQEAYAIPPGELVTMDGYRVDRDEEIKKARDLWAAADGAALGDIDIKHVDTWSGPWPDTPQWTINMFNQALGVNQFKSTRTTYSDDIIPNLANGQFPNWWAWTNQVSGPDPRAILHANFHSKGSSNFQKVNNPELDSLLDEALAETDYEKGIDLNRRAQKIILDNGQYGNVVLYNYINRSAIWNYFHGVPKVEATEDEPAQGYNIFAGHLVADAMFLDQEDPSFEGRPVVTL